MATQPEDEARTRAQRRALRVTDGAKIQTSYLTRRSEVVAVNRNDLNELLQFDGLEFAFMAVGQFFLAGGGWLFLEKFFDPNFKWDALTGFCLAAVIFGGFMAAGGAKLRLVKRDKIERIFRETEEVKA